MANDTGQENDGPRSLGIQLLDSENDFVTHEEDSDMEHFITRGVNVGTLGLIQLRLVRYKTDSSDTDNVGYIDENIHFKTGQMKDLRDKYWAVTLVAANPLLPIGKTNVVCNLQINGSDLIFNSDSRRNEMIAGMENMPEESVLSFRGWRHDKLKFHDLMVPRNIDFLRRLNVNFNSVQSAGGEPN